MAIAVTQYPADRSRLASLWIRCYHVYKDITKATVDKHLNHVTKTPSLATVALTNGIYADTLSMKDLTARQLELQSCKSAEVLWCNWMDIPIILPRTSETTDHVTTYVCSSLLPVNLGFEGA